MDVLPCALLRIDPDAVVSRATAAARDLLGTDPTGSRWDALPWREDAPRPHGQPAWLEPEAAAPRLLALTTPDDADGWSVLVDRTAWAEQVEPAARARRLPAVRPAISGVIHGLNNLLHLVMALAASPEVQASEDGRMLAERVETMGAQSAALVAAIRELACGPSLPVRRDRLGDYLDRIEQLGGKLVGTAGVELRRLEGDAEYAVALAPWPDVSQLVLQLLTHLLVGGVGRGEWIGIGSCVHAAADDLVAVELRAAGDPADDAAFAELLAEPSRSVGLRPDRSFGGDLESFGPSLLNLRLLGGDVVVAGADGTRVLRVVVPGRLPRA